MGSQPMKIIKPMSNRTPPPDAERSLPANLDAERAVLGAVLLDGVVFPQAADLLQRKDFFRDAHGRIFGAMRRLADANKPIEFLVLRDELAKHGDLDEVGGPAYLSALLDGFPRGVNIQAYAEIVAEKARLRAAIAASSKLSAAAYAAEAPSSEIVVDAAEALFAIGGDGLDGSSVSLAELVAPSIEALEKAAARGTGVVTGLATGFLKLDEMTSGLHPGDLCLVAARTSQGKTALAMNMAEHFAETEMTLVFSLEMSAHQLFMRLLSSKARVNSHRLRAANLDEAEWARISAALGVLSDRKMRIDDRGGIGVREVRARARQVQAKYGLGAIVVDYIQLMRGRGNFENRTQEIGTISRGLKAVGKELGVPVVACAQLSRNAEPKPGQKARRPQLSDLAESGSLENDADVALLIYRPEQDEDAEICRAEVIVAKQRNGPVGTVNLAWNASLLRFENLI